MTQTATWSKSTLRVLGHNGVVRFGEQATNDRWPNRRVYPVSSPLVLTPPELRVLVVHPINSKLRRCNVELWSIRRLTGQKKFSELVTEIHWHAVQAIACRLIDTWTTEKNLEVKIAGPIKTNVPSMSHEYHKLLLFRFVSFCCEKIWLCPNFTQLPLCPILHARDFTEQSEWSLVFCEWLNLRRHLPSFRICSISAPCTPVGLNIAQVLARAMRIRWSTRESQSCGTPTSVSVNYGRGSFDAKLHNQKLMEFLISPLDACQKYCIEIQLLNKAGASPVHPKVCGMTEREGMFFILLYFLW